MRTLSTPESAQNGEITKLAIIECAASVLIYAGIAVYLGTLTHLALAVVLAPLMLFRTEASAEWGLKVYGRYWDYIDNVPGPMGWFYIILGAAFGVVLRAVATVYWTLRRPLYTLQETPGNWVRQAFCTDFAHPPEIVPLEAARGDRTRLPMFAEFKDFLAEPTSVVEKIGRVIFSLPVALIGWVPSLCYRISFKATAVAYAPLIWVVHGTVRNPLPLRERLKRITAGELEKVRRGVAWVVVATLAAKVGVVTGWVELDYLEERFPSQRIVQTFVDPDKFPGWQVTLGLDALLTFFLLFFADAALARMEARRPWREDAVANVVISASFLRAVFSVLTILHFFWLAVIEVASDMLGIPSA